jgi:hypothetical protein
MRSQRVGRLAIDDRAASSTVGVVLMIAVGVILASVVGAFAFDTFDRNTEEAPQVVFEYDYDAGTDTLTITHKSGTTPEGFTLQFRTTDGASLSPPDWSGEPEVETGDSIALSSVEPDDTVLVVWEQPREGEDTAVIGTWEGPNA